MPKARLIFADLVFVGLVFIGLALLLADFAGAASGGSVPPGTSIDNQASASYVSSSGPATSATSNIVHVITQGSATGAALAVNKSVSKPTANPGDQLTFTLNVSNTGTGDESHDHADTPS